MNPSRNPVLCLGTKEAKTPVNPVKLLTAGLLAAALIVTGCSTGDKNAPILQNNDIKVTLSEDRSQ